MIPFDLQRQKWDPAGSGDAYSVQNAMGKSHLSLWHVLVREALQNSWDARLEQAIDFHVSDRLLSHAQTDLLLNSIFASLPPEGASRNLKQTLEDGRMRVLTISDSGTRGLGGPLRADISVSDGGRSDFSDFVRNFGRSQHKGLEGGTYGYGKGVLYSASQVGLCLIYSNALVNNVIESRLIGVSGGDPDYSYEGLRFTGKNWWGRLAVDGVVDPLLDSEAREVAGALDLLTPGIASTGTSIVIISPRRTTDEHESLDPVGRMKILRDAALTWAWPLAIASQGSPRVQFRFTVDGVRLPDVVPESDPRFANFAKALSIAEKWAEYPENTPVGLGVFREIISQRPKKSLGYLVSVYSDSNSKQAQAFQNTVALMRGPRIVVRYLSVAPPAADGALFSVFIVNKEAEEYFAHAEPVTHDDWIASMTKTENKANFVGIALRKIKTVFSDLGSSTANASSPANARGTAHISASLGQLVGSFSGTDGGRAVGGGSGGGSGGGRGGVRNPTALLVGIPRLFQLENVTHVAFRYQIRGGKSGTVIEVIPSSKVVVDGGSTERAGSVPIASQSPEFAGWLDVKGEINYQQKFVKLPTDEEITAVFKQPRDTAFRSVIDLVEKEA